MTVKHDFIKCEEEGRVIDRKVIVCTSSLLVWVLVCWKNVLPDASQMGAQVCSWSQCWLELSLTHILRLLENSLSGMLETGSILELICIELCFIMHVFQNVWSVNWKYCLYQTFDMHKFWWYTAMSNVLLLWCFCIALTWKC